MVAAKTPKNFRGLPSKT